MSRLLVKPTAQHGQIHAIRPENVKERCPNWDYVGFDVYRLKPGETASQSTGPLEHVLVILSGRMDVTIGGDAFGTMGGRMTLWDREKAHGAYIPNSSDWLVTAETDLELAVCTAPGAGGHAARIIAPDTTPLESRGKGANTRYVNPICMEDQEWADSLLVTEAWTPNGNWSSYPSHKHDTDAYPDETYLEETYYHRINPATGFSYQRVYNDDRSLDENIAVSDGEVVLVPEGYHPCGALYGHDLYYLNVMAGPKRKWRFRNDPDHDWLAQRDAT